MATRQQLKSQMESLREENRRLEGLLEQRTPGGPHTPGRTRLLERQDEVRKELETIREENTNLLEELQRLREAKQIAEQQRDEAVSELQSQRQQDRSVAPELETEVERLRSELRSVTQAAGGAEARARAAEKELGDMSREQSRRDEVAELQRLRALAEQQSKWEARESRMEKALATAQQQLREQSEMLQKQEEREELTREYERQILDLREQLSAYEEERRWRRTAETSRVETRRCDGRGSLQTVQASEPALLARDSTTAGVERQELRIPPPLISIPTSISSGIAEESLPQTLGEPEGRQMGTATSAQTGPVCTPPTTQITEMLSSLTQPLPSLPEFTGEEIKDDSFADWIERFEMVADLTGWTAEVKLKQLVLRLRGSAQGFYRTCTEEQKKSYTSLVTALSRRFTPVRIQALECSVFHERKQKNKESVDEYAQDLQRLFQKAYPKAALSSDDAREMGQAVLSSQFIGGLNPGIKRKVAYLEGATFTELWLKARYEEARQKDLANSQREQSDTRRKQHRYQDDHERNKPQSMSSKPFPSSNRKLPQEGLARSIRCYKCNQNGHIAKNCNAGRRVETGRQERQEARTATVTCTAQRQQVLEEDEDKVIYDWIFEETKVEQPKQCESCHSDPQLGPTLHISLTVEGIPVKALVDTGCPITIISKELCQRILKKGGAKPNETKQKLHVKKPSLALHAYCGSELDIGAQMEVHISTSSSEMKAVVLVQEGATIDALLGTDVMGQVGIRVLDAQGESLLDTKPKESTQGTSKQQQEVTLETEGKKHQVTASQNIGGRRYRRKSQERSTSQGTVHLLQAYKLPARSGRLLKARVNLAEPCVFEPKTSLQDRALDIADAVLQPDDKHCILLPVTNSSGFPIRLRRGEPIGHVTPIEKLVESLDLSIEEGDLCLREEMFGDNREDSTTKDAKDSEAAETSSESNHNKIDISPERLQLLQEQLHLEKAEVSQEERKALEELLNCNANVFALNDGELGCTKLASHTIDTGNHPPIQQQPRRLPFALRQTVDEMITQMLEQEVIEPTASPWSSPIVLVKKKDGSHRFCVDYRRLNAITKRDVYPLPRVDDILETLSGAKYFTTLDLASGYWQVTLDPAAKEKTAFVTHSGLYQFNVLPFGLCNAPATFQRLMANVLTGLLGHQCFVYLDDILVVSHDWEEHLHSIQAVIDRLQQAGLRLKPKKCKFARKKAAYLGHIVSEAGIEMDPEKVEKVQNFPAPANLKSLRQFLGLSSYYRRYIPDFSKIASPLHALTQKKVPFHWSSSCQQAFDKLKQLLTTAPVLAFPNFNKPFLLETDASGTGLGAVLSQEQDDGSIRPLAYASRTLQKHERNYGISEREALGVVWAVKHYRPFLYGHQCTVFTDHQALKSLLNTPHPSGKLARWGLALQELDLEIQYRPGKQLVTADALSRTSETEDRREGESLIEVAVLRPQEDDKRDEDREWNQLQRRDEELGSMYTYLESGDLPADSKEAKKIALMCHKFTLLDDTLYHIQADGKLQLAVPLCKRELLMQEAHAGIFSGHLRETKVYSQLQKRYWWPKMRSDVHKYCRACITCATRRVGQAARPAMTPIPVAGSFDCVGVDVIQFPQTYDGNQYAVVFMDYLTKWPEVYPTQDQTAETIARLLIEKIVCRHGVPARILSDRGASFLSELLQNIYQLLGTRKINTSAYHPQTDGLVERFNRTLTDMLAKTVERNGRDWDQHLPYVLFAYRTSMQESTGESPFFLLYGRDARLPTEAALNSPRTCYQVDVEDYKTDLVAGLTEAWDQARQHVKKAQQKQKQYYDRHSRTPRFRVGDRVFIYMPSAKQGKAWKFSRPYHGPFRILELTDTNARVRPVEKPQETPMTVSLDKVRHCPKELPEGQAWFGHRKRKKPRKKKAVPSPDIPHAVGSWSSRLRPRRQHGASK